LAKEGWTLGGLYKILKQDGISPDESVEILCKVLPKRGWNKTSREDVVKYMRKFEFGEDTCCSCQKFFIGKPGPDWNWHYCPDCQKAIDEFWDRVYAAQKESGEEMDEDTMMFAGICAMMAPIMNKEIK
jgi:hypothetical protein